MQKTNNRFFICQETAPGEMSVRQTCFARFLDYVMPIVSFIMAFVLFTTFTATAVYASTTNITNTRTAAITITNGQTVNINSGGRFNANITVEYGGVLNVNNNGRTGSSNTVTVNNGGLVTVNSGGRIDGPLVVNGGLVNLNQGGIINGRVTMNENAIVNINGTGRINGNITVNTDATLNIDGASANANRAVSARIFIEGGHVQMNSGRVGGAQNNDTPTVVVRSGTFVMDGGILHSCSGHNHGGFAVDVVGGLFTLNGGHIIGGNGLQRNNAPAVRVNENGIMIMNGGSVRGDEILSTTHGTRGVVVSGGVFTLNGGIVRGYVNANRPAVHVISGEFHMYGGSVQTGNKANARGVRVDSGTFNMHDGEIRNRSNNNSHGLAVDIRDNTTFNMYGGTIHFTSAAIEIRNNTTFNMHNGIIRSNGTGIDIRGNTTFNLFDGIIQNATRGVNLYGANVVFNMYGGYIRNHRAQQGAGVRMFNGSTFNLNGGVIENNRASGGSRNTRGGGGVLLTGTNTTLNMGGGYIRGNISDAYKNHNLSPHNKGLDGRGGGVLVTNNAVFNMTGGIIENNTAPGGGGVAVISENNGQRATAFNLYDGTIRNNRSVNNDGLRYARHYSGGGVQVLASNRTANANGRGTVATFNMYGGYVENNVATGYTKRNGEHGIAGGGVSVVTAMKKFSLRPSQHWGQTPADAVFNFHGGYIRGNEAFEADVNRKCKKSNNNRRHVTGGGVFVHYNGAVLNMFDGAVIENNESRSGGGVTVSMSGTFNMYGGRINNNIAFGGYLNDQGFELRGGGGVYLFNDKDKNAKASAPYTPGQICSRTPGNTPTFNMMGGQIVNNEAPSGGGVYWNIAVKRTILMPGIPTTAGRIPGNTASGSHLLNRLFNREANLTRVNIGPNAVIANNIAWSGTLIDDEVWARHQVGNNTVWRWQAAHANGVPNDGVSLLMRSTEGVGANPFNNHDILTWGGFTGDGYGTLETEPEYADVVVTWNRVSGPATVGVQNVARVTIATEDEITVVYLANGEVIEDVQVGSEIVIEPVIAPIAPGGIGSGNDAFRVMSNDVNSELTTFARLDDNGDLVEYDYETIVIHTLTEDGLNVHFNVEEQFWLTVWHGVYVPGFGWFAVSPAPVPPMGPFIPGQNIPSVVIPFGTDYMILLEINGVFMIQTPDGLVPVEIISIDDMPNGGNGSAPVLPQLPELEVEEEYEEEEDCYYQDCEYEYNNDYNVEDDANYEEDSTDYNPELEEDQVTDEENTVEDETTEEDVTVDYPTAEEVVVEEVEEEMVAEEDTVEYEFEIVLL